MELVTKALAFLPLEMLFFRMRIFSLFISTVASLAAFTAASSREESISKNKTTKVEKAQMVGKLIAERAKTTGIENVVFDRGGFLYHGRIKALAESARESGLKF